MDTEKIRALITSDHTGKALMPYIEDVAYALGMEEDEASSGKSRNRPRAVAGRVATSRPMMASQPKGGNMFHALVIIDGIPTSKIDAKERVAKVLDPYRYRDTETMPYVRGEEKSVLLPDESDKCYWDSEVIAAYKFFSWKLEHARGWHATRNMKYIGNWPVYCKMEDIWFQTPSIFQAVVTPDGVWNEKATVVYPADKKKGDGRYRIVYDPRFDGGDGFRRWMEEYKGCTGVAVSFTSDVYPQ